ncbi:MAG: hypothetical protein QNJ14_02435 [Woeseiaceae bacterium]|nr:hypothetical protein [Woeseiaceae bacterium]
MPGRQTRAGVHEFVFGALASERDDLLEFWRVLGFEVVEEGKLDAAAAGILYGHASALTSMCLRHPGCETFDTGAVRLQLWDALRNEGLGNGDPIETGSRWMGLYSHDILQVRDAFTSAQAMRDWNLWVSPLVNAPLEKPAPEHDYFKRFVGLRETLVFGTRFRLAFIQRGGFDRPGFGTFDDSLPFKNTEGSHANVVQPANSFDTEFYKVALEFETAPFGEPHDSGDEPPTIEALKLREGQLFRVERTRAVDCPSGLLQVYSSYMAGADRRDLSRPGSGNLCAYSVRVADLDKLAAVIDGYDGAALTADGLDEFGRRSLVFDAPDGYAWMAVHDD